MRSLLFSILLQSVKWFFKDLFGTVLWYMEVQNLTEQSKQTEKNMIEK